MSDQTRRRVLATVGGTITIGLAGCSGDGGGGESTEEDTPTPTDTEAMDGGMDEETTTAPGTANVRVAHLSPNAPNVDVYVDGDRVLSDVPFRTVSDYLELPAGDHTVEITAAGDQSASVFEGEVTLAESDYTVAAIGELESEDSEFRPEILEDDNGTPSDGSARVRVVHAAPDAPAVDVTANGTETVLFDGPAFGDAAYTEVPAGEYTLQVRGGTESNDGDVVAESPISLVDGNVYTVYASGYLTPDDEDADAPFELTATTDLGDGGGLLGTANVRVAHASPDAPNVDVYVDDERVLLDVPFRAVSDYLAVPEGARAVRITAAGDADTVAFDGELELAARDYTVAAIGELQGEDTEFRPVVLEDDNSEIGGDQARLRVLHASPDAPAVDVTAAGGDVVLFDGVPFGESGYVEVESNDYTVQIRGDTESNDGEVVADFDVSLNGGTVYTAIANGYLTPDDEPTDEDFTLDVTQDASF